jgi:Fe-S oxidoreductase
VTGGASGADAGPAADWRPELTAQLDALGRWLQGRFVIEPEPDAEVVSAERYLDLAFLREAIARARAQQLSPPSGVPIPLTDDEGDVDLRIAVSRFTRQYASSLTAVALVALGRGVGLDLSAARCRLVVRANIPFLTVLDVPAGSALLCAERPTEWPVDGPVVATLDELRAHVWRRLYGEHLGPLFERVLAVTRVSRNLMWSNAAEWVGNVADGADEYLPPAEARPFVEDTRALLEAAEIPGLAGPNPMRGLLEWLPFDAPDFPRGVQTRHVCCITYLLPDRLGRLCQNCPFMPVDERVDLIRERHGVPMGTPGGPAEQRAIERGREKLGPGLTCRHREGAAAVADAPAIAFPCSRCYGERAGSPSRAERSVERPMVTDNRMVSMNSAGVAFDISDAASFDYSLFFRTMGESERIQVSKDEFGWLERYETPDKPADVVLNLSCGVQETPHLMLTQVALFKALGVDFVATAGRQFCCGRIYQRYGKGELGDRMAAKAIERFASWEPTTNVQCCGSCFIEFGYHVDKLAEAGHAPFEVDHITDFLLRRLTEMDDAVPWQKSIPRRVLLHAEGAEVHPSKVAARNATIATLNLIPGVEYVGLIENPSHGQPCATRGPGEPSVLADLTPEQYLEVQAELADQARREGADAIVSHHHMCHREWSKFGSDQLPVIHYQSLLAEALGISVPDRFQTLWRMGDPEKVLEQTRPHWESWGIDEEEARGIVQRHFVPTYAAAIQRCPCGGNCVEARADVGAACETSWHSVLASGPELPMARLADLT